MELKEVFILETLDEKLTAIIKIINLVALQKLDDEIILREQISRSNSEVIALLKQIISDLKQLKKGSQA